MQQLLVGMSIARQILWLIAKPDTLIHVSGHKSQKVTLAFSLIELDLE